MSNVSLARPIVLALLLVLFVPLANAKDVYGYVVTNKNDTVYGTVKLSKFNMSQQTISLTAYNMEDLFDHVYFCPSGTKEFKEYFPDHILEYGFVLDRTLYKYMSKEVKATMGNTKRKFFLQKADGAISLFEIKWHYDSRDKSANPYGMDIAELYILGGDKSLIKVAPDDNAETVSDFLMKNLKLDKDILATAAQDKTFKDIVEIARSYDSIASKALIKGK